MGPSYALRIGEVVVSLGDHGLPAAERALFEDVGERVKARAQVARTTVAEALGRLRNAGIAPALVSRSGIAARRLAKAYARGALAPKILDQLDPVDLFEPRSYDGRSASYDGAWLDLQALAKET